MIYLGGLILLVSADDLLLVPVIYSLSILCGAISMLSSYRGQSSLLSRPDVSQWKSDLKKSCYLGAGHFLAQSVILLPPLAIGYFFTELQAGYYGVALKLILMAMLADHVFNTLLLPNLTRLWKEQPDKVKTQLSIVGKWMLYFGASGTLILFFSAEFLITLLFGNAYLPAAPMLMILSLLLPVTFLNSVYSFGLISFGKDRDFLISTAAGGSACMVLLISAGLSGNIDLMIGAVVLAEILITISMYLRFRNTARLSLTGYIAALGGMLLLLTISGLNAPVPALLAAVLSPLILLILLYIFGMLTRSDFTWLKHRITK
jgi:O-antigen/teichoic acid export membrane protein